MALRDDIQSTRLLKIKGALFLLLAIIAGAGLLWLMPEWRPVALLAVCIWASCRAYYFLFYVLEHYADGGPYAGLWDAFTKRRR